jgi:colanic acid/amylovoran biosynthesis glycosyltransferase
MRLGVFVPEFPSQTHAFFWREVKDLRRLGVQVSLLSSRRPPPTACQHEFAEAARRETHYVFPPRWAASLAALACRPLATLRCLAYLAGLRETPLKQRLVKVGLILAAADLLVQARRSHLDHIHVHSCAESAHVAALCFILGGPPYSLKLHGDLVVYGGDHAHKMKRARFIACDSSALCRQVTSKVGISPERVHASWMGVDTEHFRDLGLRSPHPGPLHMVTVARLNAMKGHRHALGALRRALDAGCDICYTIAGEGPYRKEIEDCIQRLNLGAHVELTGTQSEEAVLHLLQHADFFVLPSIGLGEAAPVAVMEAMACGLPVICSIIGGSPDMITHGQDGLLVEQANEEALAEAMIRMANAPEERARLGKNARARAVEAFDSSLTARNLIEAIARTSPQSEVKPAKSQEVGKSKVGVP